MRIHLPAFSLAALLSITLGCTAIGGLGDGSALRSGSATAEEDEDEDEEDEDEDDEDEDEDEDDTGDEEDFDTGL